MPEVTRDVHAVLRRNQYHPHPQSPASTPHACITISALRTDWLVTDGASDGQELMKNADAFAHQFNAD